MKRIIIISLFALSAQLGISQQLTQYSQFLFNEFGVNPAVASNSNCMDVVLGRRTQWIGFPNAPLNHFFAMSRTFGAMGVKGSWHSVGVFIEQDKTATFKHESYQPSYAYHMRVAKDRIVSMGMFLGIRKQVLSTGALDPAMDPAIMDFPILNMPDIGVGIKEYSRDGFMGFSIRQVLAPKLATKKAYIGSTDKLRPHYYFTWGKSIHSKSYYYTFVPALQVRYASVFPPTFDFTFMWYLSGLVGMGVSYRTGDAFVGILQFKIKDTIKVGIAYDYVTSPLRAATAGGLEIMLRFSSCSISSIGSKKSYCPTYDL